MAIDIQLERLATLSPAELRAEWVAHYQSEPPRLSTDLLRFGIAYRMQECALGRRRSKGGARVDRNASRKPKVGTQFVRSWNGRTICVTVTAEGYCFDDRVYRSLSAIARVVTGVQWSGPRFFGLDHDQA